MHPNSKPPVGTWLELLIVWIGLAVIVCYWIVATCSNSPDPTSGDVNMPGSGLTVPLSVSHPAGETPLLFRWNLPKGSSHE